MMADLNSAETPEEIGTKPADIVKRWQLEIKIAQKNERDWRKESKTIFERYRAENLKNNSFNVLWSNTELMRPAIYNSTPKPDVRRRFRDDDPLGKKTSELLGRCLSFSVDNYGFDENIKMNVLDMLLCGRGVARVRYVPSIVTVGTEEQEADGGDLEPLEGDAEELAWEQVTCEHVNWEDFAHGPGRVWSEVQWVGVRHQLTREELIDKFGEIGQKVNLSPAADEDARNASDTNSAIGELFMTAEVWEIWDKEQRKVIFFSSGYPNAPLKEMDDPLSLDGFYPIPCPLYAIESTTSLVPVTLYSQYQEQAKELDLVSRRINKLTDGLKARGAYDATMAELANVMEAEDNQIVPVESVAAMYDRGGIEAGIWWMPIEQAAKVIQTLYAQREQCKNVIYEILGIADIMRGQSVASETLGAQQLKHQWGSIRLQKLQRSTQMYVRDIVRIMAEVISQKFQPETIMAMSQMQLPTDQQYQQQVQQAMIQYEQQAMMMAQQGQQPPAPPEIPPKPITIDDVINVLHSDEQRSYKIDIETDSTSNATIADDMEGLAAVLTGVTQFMQGIGPLVQAGAFPIEAAKEIVMTICRRSRLGTAVEDSLDKIQAPQPAPQSDPNQAALQQAQIKAESDKYIAEVRVQSEERIAQMRAEMQSNVDQIREHAKAEASIQVEHSRQQSIAMIEAAKLEYKAQAERQKMEYENQLAQIKEQTTQQTQLLVAKINAISKVQAAEIAAGAVINDQQINAAGDGVDGNANGIGGI